MALPITGHKSSKDPNIDPLGPLDYILDLGDTASCAWIENALPGEVIKVLVYPARNPSAERIEGTAIRSVDGESLLVSFTTPDGEDGFYPVDYREIKHIISLLKAKPAGAIQVGNNFAQKNSSRVIDPFGSA